MGSTKSVCGVARSYARACTPPWLICACLVQGAGGRSVRNPPSSSSAASAPMSEQEMQALRDRVKPEAGDGRFELYKVSLKFDNPESRLAHDFPIDMRQAETKEMMQAAKNTGHPYPR